MTGAASGDVEDLSALLSSVGVSNVHLAEPTASIAGGLLCACAEVTRSRTSSSFQAI